MKRRNKERAFFLLFRAALVVALALIIIVGYIVVSASEHQLEFLTQFQGRIYRGGYSLQSSDALLGRLGDDNRGAIAYSPHICL